MADRPRRSYLVSLAGLCSLSGCFELQRSTQSDGVTETTAQTGRKSPTPTSTGAPSESPTPEPKTPTERPPSHPKWTRDFGGTIDATPVAVDDAIYARVEHLDRSPDDLLAAVDARDGTISWELETANTEVTKNSITVRDALYFVQESTTAAGISGSAALAVEFSGERRWSFEPENIGAMDQYGFDDASDTMLVGTHGGRAGQENPLMFAVDAGSGEPRWDGKVGGYDVLLRGGRGFASAYANRGDAPNGEVIREFDVRTGTITWEVSGAGNIVGRYDDVLVIATGDDRPYTTEDEDARIYGLSVSDGSELWSYETSVSQMYIEWIAAPDETVYVSLFDRIVALDATDGSVRWIGPRYQFSLRSLDLLADGMLFGTGNFIPGRTVFALDATDGTARWQWSGDPIRGLSYHDETLYVTTANQLVAFDAAGGDKLWEFENESELSRPEASTAGVFVGDGGGTLYAFSHPTVPGD